VRRSTEWIRLDAMVRPIRAAEIPAKRSSKLSSDVLYDAIRYGQTGPIVLSNYGALKSFQGQFDEAKILLDVASHWTKNKRDNGVVFFNAFLYHFNKGDIPSAVSWLKQALYTDKLIFDYCNKSLVVLDIMKNNEEIRSTVAEFNKSKKSKLAA
jgi:tetratricopeptide (TPR) repeat protein